MSDFPRAIAGGNSGDGSPLVLGDDSVVGDLFTGASAAHVLDWDGGRPNRGGRLRRQRQHLQL